MVGKKLFLKRFLRRLRTAFRFKEIMSWQYESCDRCGSCYRVVTGWVDDLWENICPKDYTEPGSGGCLCTNCAVIIAQEKGIQIEIEDVERMWLFYHDIGKSVDIIKPTGIHRRKGK